MGRARVGWSALVLALAFALAFVGCASTPASPSPLWIHRATYPPAQTSVSIAGIGACQSDGSRGVTIDPARPLVILVHGCHSSPGRFTTLAEVFQAQGQQAVCFHYDDRDKLDVSAGQLVVALEALKPLLESRHIIVLGHSQGGLVARRAFVRERVPGLRDGDGFRYELVTVSSPFHGIDASADCGSLFLHVITFGVTVVVCRMVAGAMWNEIYPRSSFMRSPGTLLASVDRHVKIVTDERSTCRRRDTGGRCLKSDFVFSLPEQYAPQVDDETRAETSQIEAGHVEIVGEAGNPPAKLIRILQEQQILAAPPEDRRAAFAALVSAIY